jgi:hypothetical protein
MTNAASVPYRKNEKLERLPAPAPKKADKTNTRGLSTEEEQIVEALKTVKGDLDVLHNRYDQTIDPLMMESLIYEIKAANLKFMYYLNLCKAQGIVCRTVKG